MGKQMSTQWATLCRFWFKRKPFMHSNLIAWGISGACARVFQFCHYEGRGPLIPVYPCSGGGPGQSEEKCSEDDWAIWEAGCSTSASHEDPQNPVRTHTCACTHTDASIQSSSYVMNLCLFCFSSECADIMTGGTRRCIVVSTLAEASFYADHGFDDILYAYPLPFDKVLWTHTPKTLILYVINSIWGYVYESKYQSRGIFESFLLT